jgi:hypothetical protein
MAFVLKDRVKETSTTTGTGTITLAGASPNYQGFSTIGDGNTTFYAIVIGSEWENGIGTYTSSGSTLSRDTVLSSSNSGNLVNFSAGTKDVFVNYPAGRAAAYDTPSQSTGALHIPVGTTAQRPTGASGMFRMNSTTGEPEWYDTLSTAWVGSIGAVQATAKAYNWNGSSSNTVLDFTGIPSWAKRITVMFSGLSLSSTANILVQLGDAGGFETTGYVSSGSATGTAATISNSTAGMIIRSAAAASITSGIMVLQNITGNSWVASFSGKQSSTSSSYGGGDKTLSDTLTQVRITTTSTDTFDAGTVNIMYE